jgi:hypothetical protein
MSNSRFGNRTRTGNVESFMEPVSPGTFLLDVYPDAAGAYSLRKLRTSYEGPAIRVRRSNDNAESDIGFDVFGFLDISALTTFVGANSGLVTTWYDQGKNRFNLTQTTAANQPRIVNSGTVDKLSGSNRPTLIFDGTSDFIQNTSLTTSTPMSIFVSNTSTVSTGAERVLFDSATTTQALLFKDSPGQNINILFGGSPGVGTAINTNFVLYSIIQLGANSNAYRNSTTQFYTNANFGSNGFNGLRLGVNRDVGSLYWSGNIAEFIVWPLNQTSNRLAIENNINNYFITY